MFDFFSLWPLLHDDGHQADHAATAFVPTDLDENKESRIWRSSKPSRISEFSILACLDPCCIMAKGSFENASEDLNNINFTDTTNQKLVKRGIVAIHSNNQGRSSTTSF